MFEFERNETIPPWDTNRFKKSVKAVQSSAVGLPLDNFVRKELVDKFHVVWLAIMLEGLLGVPRLPVILP